jgi:hypothetical protein
MKSLKLTGKEITALLIAIETHYDVTSDDNLFDDIADDLENVQKKLYKY